jgi:RHS repeat-associated protein
VGGEPVAFTTTIERDAQGRPLVITEPELNSAGKPSDKTPSSISGLAKDGQTLAADTGMWAGTPSLTYTYQWQRCNSLGGGCGNISGATSATYLLGNSDVEHTVRVAVTAANSAGSATSTSVTTTVVSSPLPLYGSSFGSFGSGSGQLLEPSDLATSASGNLWVADTENARLEEWNSSGTLVRTVGSYGSENGEFEGLYGVAIDSAEDVWTSECGNDRIDEFSPEGVFIKSFGSKGSGNEQFNCPEGLAVSSSGNIYVADRGNHRVLELNSEGKWIKTYSQSTEHEGPFDVKLDTSGDLWVSYAWESKIAEFGAEGTLLELWGTKGTAPGDLEDAYRLKIGPEGNIWVAEWGNNRVQVFTPTGVLVTGFGEYGSGEGQFSHARGIAFSGSSVYALDSGEWSHNTGNSRIEKWLDAGIPANTSLPSTSGELIAGQTLQASIGNWTGTPSLTYTYQWQHCNSGGESCSNISGATNSTYALGHGDVGDTLRVVITATNTYGSTSSTSATTEVLPQLRTTEYAYDANGNLESIVEPNGHKTKYTYDADNERTKIEEPNGTITETTYDNAAQITGQTDGNKHTTKYTRNALEEVTEIVGPLGNKTTKEYDLAGNLTSAIDPEKRTTSYTYNQNNQLTEIKYSDGKTPAVKYEYDKDGNQTVMTDGTGTTTYTYDQLDRLTEAKDGHGNTTKYEYDLDDEPTKITYPNGKSITRAYNSDGQLEGVTDWYEHTTRFAYNADGYLTVTKFPEETTNEDTYTYNDADQMSEVKMLKGTETLASIGYSRENDGGVTATTDKGLPGIENTESTYDTNSHLTKNGSVGYEYDAANNPIKIGSGSYKYNNADQLETGPGITYTYDELGERIGEAPTTGPATTYSYNQAGGLVSIKRPKEGETPSIEDSYSYNGNGLRTSQTISGSTSYFSWDTISNMPLIVNDGTNSYIYGPEDLPIEQINNTTGTAIYLHHDQAGSTRLITGSTGTAEGKCSYSGYGVPTCEGSGTTPLGYDAQYTNTDTGLVYMRARVYDPATAQFLSVDPMVGQTDAPYNYAGDNPLNEADPTGLGNWLNLGLPSPGEVAETLNPIKYYEEEIESYENGCGYWASVAHGLEGAVVGALDAGGAGEEELGAEATDRGVAGVIKGYTQHVLEQAIERDAGRGVSPSAILDAVRSPLSKTVQNDGATKYVGQNAVVVVSGDGQVITTYARNSAGLRGQS